MTKAITKYGRLWPVDFRSLLRYGTPRKFANALRTEWAFRRHKSDIDVVPYILIVEPLYYCNLRCPLCARETIPHAREKAEAGKLPLDLFDQVLEEIGKYLFQVQIFGNGEPLLDWPRTQQIVSRAHRRRIFTLMSTNCTLVGEKIAEELVASDLDYVICGIDGITQKSYEAYRVGGSVDDALGGLRRLVEQRSRQRRKLFIEWQFLINRFNSGEIDEVRRMVADLGVYLRLTPIGGVEANPELRRYWSADVAREALGDQTACSGTDCTYLWRIMTLNSNGQLARCNYFGNVAQLGAAQGESVVKMYNGASTRRARQLFSRAPVEAGDFPWPCSNCGVFQRRHGGPVQDIAGEATAARNRNVSLTLLNPAATLK
ncbi:MAG TPA: radical SAM/SPASM domain-containing protein [Tepidisphaeraceae bacterium]|jgi:MoaA/NifB/PqqE/SkfB family radical SAM enzyme|nr:radical SAM/SPASM domain-containing protein [Tepidisphaeraceae bacterium]